MHAPLAKFSMMRQLMSSSANWWLAGSEVDLDFQNALYHDDNVTADDPLVANTVLMLHGDGVDGVSNISDSTGRNFITPTSAEIDTAQSKFGGASIVFSNGNLRATSADFLFGTGDITIDFWVRFSSVASAQNLFDGTESAANSGVVIGTYIPVSNLVLYAGTSGEITGTTALATGQWYHVAFTRSGTSAKLFLNGVQEGSTWTNSNNYAFGNFRAGRNFTDTQPLSGWLDEFRILKGVAAWTTTFTPPSAAYNVGVGPYDLLSCSRASIGYAQTAAGTLTQFAANQLRITDQGLLVEDARTNLLLRSQEFDSSPWSGFASVTVDANVAVAPDGTTTAEKLTALNTDANVNQAISSGISAGSCTYSIYLKADTPTTISIYQTGDGTNSTVCNVTTTWQRFTLTYTSTGAGATFYVGGGASFATPEIVYAWGAQVEAGAFASSYVPTTTAAATRAADVVTAVGALITTLGGEPASVVGDVIANATLPASTRILGVSGNSPTLLFASTNSEVSTAYAGASPLAATLGNSLTFTAGAKGGVAWDSSGRSVVGGGGTVNSDASHGGVPLTTLGAHQTGTSWFGYFRRLTAWTSRLADATLQGFTNP